MARFRVKRHLKRDVVASLSYLYKGVVTQKRRLVEYSPADSEDGWLETQDEVLLDSLKSQYEELPYSPAMEDGLKSNGVDYEYSYCPSCGGRKVRKLRYYLFEVEDEIQ